ncbi:photosystem I reaction center subunit PsaK [Leptolyngbya sp. FACHB-36]|uniref:photosystem I reaction center subunit PsaK n=1 Tax=Leptolyngbya sp. FACHB-36 TaxID=2692808 RepID=UPI001680DF2A|nr:photosystem I reaction center subunit PsaK [Leptolyngbya sp. FACHB-36]MBD2018655.1 photosystem I reaction center subunit PsaK [Leptolyngbya sp. FACHB-36]
MLNALLLVALGAQDAGLTPTEAGNPWIKPIIMTLSCLLVLFIAGRSIERPHDGPKMPLPFPSLFNNPSVGTFLGSMSFGHLLGALAIFGFSPYFQ